MPLIIILVCLFFSNFALSDVPKDFPSQAELETFKDRQTEELNFERIIDGDTFAASGKKIRLWGIDAPKRGDENYNLSPFALEHFVSNYILSCKFIETDRYQRYVMQCFANGEDLGSMMVKFGFAKDYNKYSGGFYKQEQKFARE